MEADVEGRLWIKRGSVVAYTGDFRFHLEPVVQAERLTTGHGPVRSAIKRELVPLVRACGHGRLFLTDDGRGAQVRRLADETLYVSSSRLLAFDPALHHELRMLGSTGILSGAFVVVKVSGRGDVALGIGGEALALAVEPGHPLSVDPAAVVAWTEGLWPELKTDVDAGSLIGHGGGQPVQMRFAGRGEVTVHARKRIDFGASALKMLAGRW